MECHYCDRPATFDIESDGIVVWVCDAHLREQFTTLARLDDVEALCDTVFQ